MGGSSSRARWSEPEVVHDSLPPVPSPIGGAALAGPADPLRSVPVNAAGSKRRRRARSPEATKRRAFRKNVRRLDQPEKRDVAIANLNRLMLDERYYAMSRPPWSA
jgi:hypothetical protein